MIVKRVDSGWAAASMIKRHLARRRSLRPWGNRSRFPAGNFRKAHAGAQPEDPCGVMLGARFHSRQGILALLLNSAKFEPANPLVDIHVDGRVGMGQVARAEDPPDALDVVDAECLAEDAPEILDP